MTADPVTQIYWFTDDSLYTYRKSIAKHILWYIEDSDRKTDTRYFRTAHLCGCMENPERRNAQNKQGN